MITYSVQPDVLSSGFLVGELCVERLHVKSFWANKQHPDIYKGAISLYKK